VTDGLTIFVVFFVGGLIALAAFCAWTVVAVVRGAWRGLTWLIGADARAPVQARAGAQVCPRSGCGAANPPQARFCRRCGMELAGRMML